MTVQKWLRENWSLSMAFVLATWIFVPLQSHAQSSCSNGVGGNNAVYNTTCNNGGAGVVGSPAFIDASVFGGGSTTFCSTIYGIFTNPTITYPQAGAVIDARGLSSTNTNMVCAAGTTPWYNGNSYANVPSTILLPAGIIQIPSMWVLPDGTKIIGEGAGGVETNNNGMTFVAETTLLACGNPPQCTNFSGSAMIQMCGSGTCHSVGIEDLSLNGDSIPALNGIVNSNSQELSYVNRVNLYSVLGYGLSISGSAKSSGPYTNIVYNTSGSVGLGCVQIEGVATRGVHGLTCESTPDSTTAIFLDASNNSLEDIRIVGFYNGVVIGSSQLPAKGNVLRNIYGDTTPSTLAPVYVIRIESNAADTAIMGVANAGPPGTVTIKDDLTGATLQESYVSMYALGEKDTNSGGYPRFTTSPNAATWAVGKVGISGNPTCSVPGSLYSNENASSGQSVLWLCVKVSGESEWQIVQ